MVTVEQQGATDRYKLLALTRVGYRSTLDSFQISELALSASICNLKSETI